jgi:hypothetical protein
MAGLNINEIATGGKAFPFENIGDKVTGKIKVIERRQQTSFDGGAPLTWDDGSPRMLTYVELETDLRDEDDDDGIRALYCKGGARFEIAEGKGKAAEVALVEAAKQAGVSDINVGDKLTVVYSGKAKATVRGYQPAKMFVMKLEPTKGSVSVDEIDLFDD